ncbi:aminotransferase class IV family protein [Candidatus Calescamantes bacterium]|nr:aminotransferase class IV family protein [Candidatus Calescamantes bacterium]
MRKIWWNGKFHPYEEIRVFVEDPAFLYGEGLFETIKVIDGGPCFLEEHWERLSSSALRLSIPLRFEKEEVKEAVKELIKRNSIREGVLHFYLTPISLYLSVKPSLPYGDRDAFRAIISSFRRNEFSPLTRHKVMNFYENRLARREAEEKGYDEAILLNTRGEVAEGAYSNIFIVKNGILLTPPVESGALPGIVRKKVLEIAEREGIKVKEAKLHLEDLKQCEEIFFTSSLAGVMPCREVEKFFKNNNFPLTLFLKEKFLRVERLSIPD